MSSCHQSDSVFFSLELVFYFFNVTVSCLLKGAEEMQLHKSNLLK